MRTKNKEQTSQLLLKDKITLNDLRIKIGKAIEHASKKNVNILSVAVRTTADNLDNAKGVLMNVKSVAPDKLKPLGKFEEYGVNNKGDEVTIGGSNNATIDMSADQLNEYLKDENIESLYVRQMFEVLRKKEGTELVESNVVSADIDRRFKNIRNTIDDMFRAHSVVKEKGVEKKKADVMVRVGFKSTDSEFMSIEQVAKKNVNNSVTKYMVTDLEEKLNNMEGVSLISKIRHYNSHNEKSTEQNQKVLRIDNDLSDATPTFLKYRKKEEIVDPGIQKLQKFLRHDPAAFENVVSHFKTNNLEFTDRNIMEYLEFRNRDTTHNHKNIIKE